MFQIVLVSSSLSDRDQSLFLSTDEGATFQKQLIPFSVETLIFHPKEEDKVLAYTKESKVSRPGAGVWAEGARHCSFGWGHGELQAAHRGVPGALLPKARGSGCFHQGRPAWPHAVGTQWVEARGALGTNKHRRQD